MKPLAAIAAGGVAFILIGCFFVGPSDDQSIEAVGCMTIYLIGGALGAYLSKTS